MKKIISFITVFFLSAVYFTAANFTSSSVKQIDSGGKLTNDHKEIVSDFFSSQFCPTSQSESSINTLNSFSGSFVKNPNKKNRISTKNQELKLNLIFRDYVFISKIIFVLNPKTDIFFPFHHFW